MLSATSLLLGLLLTVHTGVRAQSGEAVWSTIVPNATLNWTPCYTAGQCARFEVPLNYTRPNGPKAAIALFKIPSTLSPTDANYKGPILFNPGGPGDSGVDWVNGNGALFQQILGPEYDLIGFDPRGVSRTTPLLRTFSSNAEALTFSLKVADDPPFNSTPGALSRTYARFKSFGALAERRDVDVAPYVSTPLVAQDMLAIVRAHGREKLQYWGISYGTVLGMTFASMFPNNVGRIVVDGVIDAPNYYATLWSDNLLDTDKVLDEFYASCASAGPSECAIAEPTADGVKDRLDGIFTSLKNNPVGVDIGNGTLDYGVVDYGMLRSVVLVFLYRPFTSAFNASSLADALAALEHGNGGPLWAGGGSLQTGLECACDGPTAQTSLGFQSEASIAISCTDGVPVNDSVDQLQAWYEANANLSSFADVWPPRILCAGWKIRAAHRFTGQVGGNTSFPLLLIGNTADPVAPVANAHKMSGLFSGSMVLTQDGPGHTSFAGTSPCTMQAVRAYFQNGTLPTSGTVCPIEESMFGNSTAVASDDVRLTTAVRQLVKNVQVRPLGLLY